MVSSPCTGQEGILGCAGLRMGGGRRWDSAKSRENREGGGGPWAAARVADPSARGTWAGAGTRRSAPSHCFPARRPWTTGARAGDPPPSPPSVRGQICWGKGKGPAVTDGVRRGSGANWSLAVGPRELGAVAFTAGMCVRVVAVVLL